MTIPSLLPLLMTSETSLHLGLLSRVWFGSALIVVNLAVTDL